MQRNPEQHSLPEDDAGLEVVRAEAHAGVEVVDDAEARREHLPGPHRETHTRTCVSTERAHAQQIAMRD